jgi:CheY-like chemotaxis protein
MSYRIVVADKDPAGREAVTRFLSGQDSEFISVSSSSELKQAIKGRKPDLIIMNAVLSDAPGWKIVPRIKESKEYAEVPILLVTGDPGSPAPSEVQSVGADRYLSKPIDGSTLKNAVESLLGIGGDEAGGDDEEIVIDFDDDESGEMTEDLLDLSSAAIDEEESPPDVGDTVEIDAGTLEQEIDEIGAFDDDEGYGDTVKLNLDDMELEERDSDGSEFEPTIELVPEAPTELYDSTAEMAAGPQEIEAPDTGGGGLPDFDSVTREIGTAKDSVTVDLDVDELSLELDTEDIDESTFPDSSHAPAPDDADMEEILEVQDPSKIITSEDLMVDDDSLVRNEFTEDASGELDVIDLEEDEEIGDIDREELLGIDFTEEEETTGPSLDGTTVPVESGEMQQLAQEDLESLELEEIEESAIAADDPGPSEELAADMEEGELTLEDLPAEEMTTEEFFGEELPTEEFPTEKFPDEENGAFRSEVEISLEDQPVEEELRVETQVTEDLIGEELSLEAEPSEAVFEDEAIEDEAVLEVTEDISLDEIAMEPEAPEVPPAPAEPEPIAQPLDAPRLEPGQELATGVVADLSAAGALPTDVVSRAVPSQDQVLSVITSSLGRGIKEALPGKDELTTSVQSALKSDLPDRDAISDLLVDTFKSVLPSKEELVEAYTRGTSETRPDGDALLSRIDQAMTEFMPSKDEFVEAFARKTEPPQLDTEAVLARIDDAVKATLPSKEECLEALGKGVAAVTVEKETLLAKIDDAVKSALPSKEEYLEAYGKGAPDAGLAGTDLIARIEETVGALIPSKDQALAAFSGAGAPADIQLDNEALMSRIGEAVRDALPSKEECLEAYAVNAAPAAPDNELLAKKIEETITNCLPAKNEILDRVDSTMERMLPPAEQVAEAVEGVLRTGLPPEEILNRMEKSLQALTASDKITEALAHVTEALPSGDEIVSRVTRSLDAVPSSEEVLSVIEARLDDMIPQREELRSNFRSVLESRFDAALAELDLKSALPDIMPSADDILTSFKESLPEKESFQEVLALSLTRALENSLPERVWLESVSRGLFDERTKGVLPTREEVVVLLRQEIQVKMLDAVERIVQEQIKIITSGLEA